MMSVQPTVHERVMLRRYLLGELPSADADQIEDRFAAELAFFNVYEEVEQTLIRDYARGELEAPESVLFERNYLTTAERRQQVTIVRALLAVESEQRESRRVQRVPLRRLAIALAFAALIVAVTAIGIYRRRLDLQQSAAQRQVPATAKPAVRKKAPAIAARAEAPPAPVEPRPLVPLKPTEVLKEETKDQAVAGTSKLPQAVYTQEQASATAVPAAREEAFVPAPTGPPAAAIEPRPPVAPDPTEVFQGQTTGQVAACTAKLQGVIYAQGQGVAAIQKTLESEYQLTKTTDDKSDIVTAGSVLVLCKDKVLMVAATSAANPCINTYRDGKITPTKSCGVGEKLRHLPGFGHVPGGGSAPATRNFVSGEKFWVTKIDVRANGVVLDFLTDPTPAGDQGVRYKSTLVIPFGAMTPTPAEALKIVADVITVAPSLEDAELAAQPSQPAAPEPNSATVTGSEAKPTSGSASAAHNPTTTIHLATSGAKPAAAAGGGKTFGTGGKTMAPKGSTTVQARNGGSVTKRADGHVATVHDAKRGMDVHHTLSGNRRVEVERRDHSRVVAERGGRGYVQRPYMFHGHEYARRSYYYHGRYYNNYYGRYGYHGLFLNPYFPSYYYGAAFYGWAYNPWAAPIAYGWGWGGNPWFGYYGAFFTPYPVYASPSLWLTDFIIANSLQAAYVAQAAALSNPAPLTPETKQLIADEVRQLVALENNEAKTAGQGAEPDAASSSIARLLIDGKQHVFVAGRDLDVVDAGGTECALSEGDAIQLTGQTAPDAQAVTVAILASKGGKECPKGDTVSVALTDLQEMQNHMRESIDQGMRELQTKQGQRGLPAAPASAKATPVESPMAGAAPPPPMESEVKAEINQQSQEADMAEAEAAGGAASGPGPNADVPVSVDVGQTMDQVEATLGQPMRKVTVGAKTIYFYKDMKVTFTSGKVTDVQ